MTLASFISPYQRDRDLVRSRLSEGDFIEVHMNVSILPVCCPASKIFRVRHSR